MEIAGVKVSVLFEGMLAGATFGGLACFVIAGIAIIGMTIVEG